MAKPKDFRTPAEKKATKKAAEQEVAAAGKVAAEDVKPQTDAMKVQEQLAKARGERQSGAQEYITQISQGQLSGEQNTADSADSYLDLTPERHPNAVSHNPSYHNELYGHISEIRQRLRAMAIDDSKPVEDGGSRVKITKSNRDTVHAISRHLDLAEQKMNNSLAAHKAGGAAALTAVDSFSGSTDHIHDAITLMKNKLGTRNAKYIRTDEHGQGYAALGGAVEDRLSALAGAYATHVAGSVRHDDAYEIAQKAEKIGARNYSAGVPSPSYTPPREVTVTPKAKPTVMDRSATDAGATHSLVGGSLRFDVTRNPVRTLAVVANPSADVAPINAAGKPKRGSIAEIGQPTVAASLLTSGKQPDITTKVGEALDADALRASADNADAVKEASQNIDVNLAIGASKPAIPYNSTAGLGDPNHPVRLRLARDVVKQMWQKDPANAGKTFIGSDAHTDPYAYHLQQKVKEHFLKQPGNTEADYEGSDAQRFPESYREAWDAPGLPEGKGLGYKPPVEESFVLRRMAENVGIPLRDLPTKTQSEDAEKYGGETIEDVARAKESAKIAEERAAGNEVSEEEASTRLSEAEKGAGAAQRKSSGTVYGAQQAKENKENLVTVKHEPIRDDNTNLSSPSQTILKFSDDTTARIREAEQHSGGPLEHEDVVDLLNPEERKTYEEHVSKTQSPEFEGMDSQDNLDETPVKGGRSSSAFHEAATAHLDKPLSEES